MSFPELQVELGPVGLKVLDVLGCEHGAGLEDGPLEGGRQSGRHRQQSADKKKMNKNK